MASILSLVLGFVYRELRIKDLGPILLGVAGALIAGWIGHAVGWYDTGEGAGFIAAIVGAILLLLIYRLIAARRV